MSRRWSCTERELDVLDTRNARYLAEHIPGARLAEMPGATLHRSWAIRTRFFAELQSFLKEVVEGEAWEAEPDRVLATVLFTDIVDSTARAAELGDRAWRQLLQQHHEIVRSQLGRFRGKEMDTAGDGFFATFDGPARAIHCAFAIRDGIRDLDLEVRAGLHTGECELVDGKAGGIAVHIGARVGIARGRRRGAGFEHGQGSRRGLGNRVRGSRRAPAQGSARRVASLRGD